MSPRLAGGTLTPLEALCARARLDRINHVALSGHLAAPDEAPDLGGRRTVRPASVLMDPPACTEGEFHLRCRRPASESGR